MNLLAIDTSTDFCSVAASRGEALFSRHERAGQRQAEMILGMVDEVLAEARIELAQIHGIAYGQGPGSFTGLDRKSTRLNSSHRCISYAVFCLKKKKQKKLTDEYINQQQTYMTVY